MTRQDESVKYKVYCDKLTIAQWIENKPVTMTNTLLKRFQTSEVANLKYRLLIKSTVLVIVVFNLYKNIQVTGIHRKLELSTVVRRTKTMKNVFTVGLFTVKFCTCNVTKKQSNFIVLV